MTPELVARPTIIDYASRLALVAIDRATGRVAAIGRSEPVGGLATEQLRLLAHAAERGIGTFTGTCLAENRAVAALPTWAQRPGKSSSTASPSSPWARSGTPQP